MTGQTTADLGATSPSGAKRSRLSRAAWAWAVFEAGQVPYLFLITGYVFMPYFTREVVGDPVLGQAYVASAVTIAGIIVALTAPFLGASVDQFGARKPWLFVGTLLLGGVCRRRRGVIRALGAVVIGLAHGWLLRVKTGWNIFTRL